MTVIKKNEVTYDAIVIGSGISGGYAAMELCTKGYKTLILERGRMVKRGEYPTANKDTWEFPNQNLLSQEEIEKHYSRQNGLSLWVHQDTKHWINKEDEYPYDEDKPFDWIRGYHVGGRSLMWGRHCYRWSDIDFGANAKEGIAIDWPIRYKDIEPWYDYVETFVGVSGQKEGLKQVPNGRFLPPFPLNCAEQHFSNQVATLPVAEKTVTICLFSVVSEIVYDKATGKAFGVKIIDAETREATKFFLRIVLNSRSEEFPNGLGNSNGELGHNLMDHHYGMGVSASVKGFEDAYYKGRKPLGFYIPRFTNIDEKTKRKEYFRGFGYQGTINRGQNHPEGVMGEELKQHIFKPDPYMLYMTCFGEILPYHENKTFLNFDKKDKNGMPIITFDAKLRENENGTTQGCGVKCGVEMLAAAGCEDIQSYNDLTSPGACIHEMGTARVGHNSKASVLNKWNQMHDVPNVFVTDGSFMTSLGTKPPSITYITLTARAVDYVHKQM